MQTFMASPGRSHAPRAHFVPTESKYAVESLIGHILVGEPAPSPHRVRGRLWPGYALPRMLIDIRRWRNRSGPHTGNSGSVQRHGSEPVRDGPDQIGVVDDLAEQFGRLRPDTKRLLGEHDPRAHQEPGRAGGGHVVIWGEAAGRHVLGDDPQRILRERSEEHTSELQ